MEITQERMRELFRYEDGVLFWAIKPSRDTRIGDRAGCVRNDSYVTVRVERRKYLAHRLIYLMHHGYLPRVIDHIDGDPSNNRIENLRAATQQQNIRNRGPQANNKLGIKGVHWCKEAKKFIAKIKANGRHIVLGKFDDPELAGAAYAQAAAKHHGEFART